MTTITETDLESVALAWLSQLGWQLAHSLDIAPGKHSVELDYDRLVVLECRPRDVLLSWLVSAEVGIEHPANNANAGGSD